MNRFAFKCSLLGVCLALGVTAGAQTAAPAKTQTAAQNKAALARYDSDKKLCNDETSSTARLQCRRDAKAEYDKALADIKAGAVPTTQAPQAVPAQAAASAPVCAECGRVIAVSVTEKEGEGSALGLLGGGAAGALLGHQVGSGSGRTLATVAGALGGAYAGKKIEEKVKTHKVWIVSVQFDDGGRGNFEFDKDPGVRVGDAVRKSGDSVFKSSPP
ncbi:MAG: hypothetical protein B7Y51_07575 [Burkholderiales bacterium 28-67-8]|nr:MAG: hypothetical protein B7Y51_07575 [Burkholderiales bacterium 28-67-8]